MSYPDEVKGLTRGRVLELMSFDAETGNFRWLKSMGPATRPGQIAGSIHFGYRIICIDGRKYRAHRLVWLVVTGKWPANQIDHINRVRSDNRPENLREATDADNRQNKSISSNNRSGVIGVCWDRSRNRWMANIKIGGRQKCIGRYLSKDEATEAYRKAKSELHKFHGAVIA